MTLLEALTALVILGLAATGFLAVFDGAARAARRADATAHLVAQAEATLAEAAVRGPDAADFTPAPAGLARRVELRPWHRAGLAELVVTVRTTEGDSVQLRRLVRAP
jgi:type II secretory pathway pseudopilin PulG